MTIIEDQEPDNMGIYEPLKQEITKIEQNRKQIAKLNARYRASASPETDKIINNELEKIMNNNTQLVRTIKEEIQKENLRFQNQGKKLSSQTQNLQEQNLLNAVTRKFKSACTDFETTLSHLVHNLRDKQIRQIKIMDTDHKLTNDDIEDLVDDPIRANDVIQKQFQLAEVGDSFLDALVTIEEKHEGMKKIEREIEQLRELFNELSTLVHEQQARIDSIQDHVSDTQKFVVQGVEKLKKAENKQKCTGRMRCYMFCCCFIALVVIILAIFVKTK